MGQTAGTWSARFEHRAEAFHRHLGQVADVGPDPFLAGHARATVRFPVANVEGDLAGLLVMIFGKYSMAGPAKVMEIRVPEGYGTAPRHGIAGIRRLTGVVGRPPIMAIFKPALGLSADDHATILGEVADAGLDIIKDDEILGDLPSAPTMQRLRACRRELDRVKAATGRDVLYAVNLSGRARDLLARARALVAEGANALLVNVLAYGFPLMEELASDPEVGVPLFAHPALAGAMCGAPDHGFSYPAVLGSLMAHSGADAVLYPASYGSLPFDPADEAAIRDRLRARGVFPVPSAGIHPGIVGRALADYGPDVILNAGTGIMDHPDGPADGVRAFHEALACVSAGRPLDPDTVDDGPLRRALVQFGGSTAI